MDWERVARDDRRRNDPVTVPSGMRNRPGEPGPNPDPIPTRKGTAREVSLFRRALKDCSHPSGGSLRLKTHRHGATFTFTHANQQATFEAAVIDSEDVSVDALISHTPFHAAVTSLQYAPRNAWWPLRIQLERLPGASSSLIVWLRADPQEAVAADAGRVFIGFVEDGASLT
jgi:hypothetical protein